MSGLPFRLTSSVTLGAWRLPSPLLVVLAAIGASLLVIIGTTEWQHFNDEHAYWLAGERLAAGAPLYDLAAAPNTPFAYWYPPPLAQVLAPFTSFVAADAFSVAWTILLLACLWWLAGRDVLLALAFVAFLPVAVELRVRNVHLLLAVLVVLGLRRSWAFWVPAAALKITPVLGIAYLAAAGRWRDAAKVSVLGLVVLGLSVVLAPDAWQEFIDIVGARAGTDGGSILPFAIPFPVRFAAGGALSVLAGLMVAGRIGRGELGGVLRRWGPQRAGETLLVIGLTIANPTLWMTAFALLVAIVPLWRTARPRAAAPTAAPSGKRELSAT